MQESVQAVQIQGGAQIVMAVGFPLSRQRPIASDRCDLVPHPFQDATQQLCRFPQPGSAGLSWLELEFGEANEASIL